MFNCDFLVHNSDFFFSESQDMNFKFWEKKSQLLDVNLQFWEGNLIF